MDVLARLDQARAETNVLEHPFYRRWSAGELSAGELSCYAGEYRHAVRALARTSALAAAGTPARHAGELRRHADEEESHVALWEQFAQAAGARAVDSGPPLAHTEECAQAWGAGDQLLEHLAVLYAIEAGQPEISQTKLEGLTAHYGFRADSPAVEYFTVHQTRDRDHARQARELIAELIAQCQAREQVAEQMVSRAQAALEGNWRLLDGVEEAAGVAAGA